MYTAQGHLTCSSPAPRFHGPKSKHEYFYDLSTVNARRMFNINDVTSRESASSRQWISTDAARTNDIHTYDTGARTLVSSKEGANTTTDVHHVTRGSLSDIAARPYVGP